MLPFDSDGMQNSFPEAAGRCTFEQRSSLMSAVSGCDGEVVQHVFEDSVVTYS